MELILFFAPAAAAALLAYLLTPMAGRLAVALGALDHPGPRKIHHHPMPRLGGLAVIAAVSGVALAMAFIGRGGAWHLPDGLMVGIALGLLPIAAISIRDDIKPVPAVPKFVVHFIGAAIAVSFGVSLNADVHLFGRTVMIGWFGGPLSVLWLMGTTSAFNIVDGLDGLSAGLAAIAACALAGVFLLADQTVMAAAALVVAGGVVGLLPYNMYPARVFFGDIGATAIGFCLGAFALRGGATLSAGFAALVPVFVLGLPIAETAISMVRRVVRRLEQHDGGGVFDADRNHMHHRLLALGIQHRDAVLILYAAGAALAGVALVSMLLSARESALLVTATVMAGALGVRRLGYDEFALIRRGVVLKAYEAPVMNRSMFVMAVDVAIVAIAAVAAVAIKTDWSVTAHRAEAVALTSLLAPITIAVFWRMGIYRQTWRLAGIDEFSRACASAIVVVVVAMTARSVLMMRDVSISLLASFAMIHVLLLVGCRASYQMLAASRWRIGQRGTPVLIYGAGRHGVTALCELAAAEGGPLRPVAFIDDDPAKRGTMVRGLPVAGAFATIEHTVRQFSARAIVIAADTLTSARVADLDQLCARIGVGVLKLRVSIDAVAGAAVALPPPAADVTFVEPLRPRPECAVTIAPDRCPVCASGKLHRSHVRRVSERVRKHLTHKRLYRCNDCGWRGWSSAVDAAAFEPPTVVPTPPSLEGIDSVLRARSLRARAS